MLAKVTITMWEELSKTKTEASENEIMKDPSVLNSNVWNYFGFVNKDEMKKMNVTYVICKVCLNVVSQ